MTQQIDFAMKNAVKVSVGLRYTYCNESSDIPRKNAIPELFIPPFSHTCVINELYKLPRVAFSRVVFQQI